MQPFLSCVIPAYNEAANLKDFVPALSQVLKQETGQFEIIVINDGSTDSTLDILKSFLTQYPLHILSFSRNFGKEAAISAGLEHAKGDVCLLIDADFQHPIDAIPTMINLWKAGYDMVYGVRSRHTESWFKRVLTKIYYRLLSWSSAVKIPEDAGDFRLLDAKVINAMRNLPEKNLYMKGLYAWVGFKSIGLEFVVQNRQHGQSNFNFRSLFNLGLAGLTSFSDLPLRMFIYLGALLAFASILYGGWIVIQTLVEGNRVPGWTTLAAGIAYLGGIQLLGIGILGEYIGRIYTEVKNRPKYIIDSEYKSFNVNKN